MSESCQNREAPVPGDVFECQLPVRWGDLDAVAHVNNTVYFRYAEEARAQLFEQVGMTVPSDVIPVLVHASFDFLKPLFYPATVSVILEFVRFGRSSLEFDVLVVSANQPDVLHARGKNISVKAAVATGEAVAWTKAEKAAYAAAFTANKARKTS